MTAALATFALPAAALATWALIRSPLGRRFVAEPRGDRWHERQTPLLGGIGLFAGIVAGVGAALAADALEPSRELFGILGRCAIRFPAGLAVGLACAGFLPFNLRSGKPAAIFMGDSGSQLLGFALAALGLSASWKAAGTTVAAIFLPILVLAVPLLDTTLVTIVRILEGRPIYQGGRDHTSHRLVYRGLSEKRAVLLLGLIAVGLGGTSLAYNNIGSGAVTLVGVLLTFALLVH